MNSHDPYIYRTHVSTIYTYMSPSECYANQSWKQCNPIAAIDRREDVSVMIERWYEIQHQKKWVKGGMLRQPNPYFLAAAASSAAFFSRAALTPA
jgi:hypothetical protein